MAAHSIVHFDSSRVWRGGQHQLLLLAHALRNAGCNQLICAPDAAVRQRYEVAGLECTASVPAAMRRARSASVLHAHDGRALGWALLAGWAAAKPVVTTRRVTYRVRFWGAWKYRRSARVVCVSEAVARSMRQIGVEAANVHIIPDAVDPAIAPDPAAARAQLRQALHIEGERFCAVCVSAFTAEKGVGDLVEAAKAAPETVLLLSGEGKLDSKLRSRVKELGLQERVFFREQLPAGLALPTLVAGGDVFVLPSRAEGLGSSLLLAWVAGTPVVASAVGGIPELIKDGVNGRLVPPASPAALAQGINELRGNRQLAQQWARAGREAVEESYSPKKVCEQTVAVYNELA